MNPKTINTANVINFGFKTIVDLVANTITVDILGVTTFKPGGVANLLGIWFEIIGPSGQYISSIDPLSPDIPAGSSATSATFPISMVSRYGFYTIKAVLKEANGIDHILQLSPIEVCTIGETTNNAGYVESKLTSRLSCVTNKINFGLGSVLRYKKLVPVTTVNNYAVIFPDENTAPIQNISSIPISIQATTTGTYVFKGRTIATYNLGELFYVKVGYEGRQEMEANCQGQMLSLVCCLDELATEAKNCDTATGRAAKDKQSEIFPYLFQAMIKEKSGQDISELVNKIKKIAGCDCKCDEVQLLTGQPLQNPNGKEFIFEGAGGTDVDVDENGNTITILISSMEYEIINADIDDEIFTIQTNVIDNKVVYTLALNKDKLAEFIYNSLTGSSEYNQWLISFIQNNKYVPGIDMKCLFQDSVEKNYHAELCASNTPANSFLWKRININGTWYTAPTNLDTVNTSAATTWLNGLGLGTFVVTANTGCDCAGYFESAVNGFQISVDSDGNINTIGTIEIAAISDSQAFKIPVDSTAAINSAKNIDDVLQALIDWICNFCLCEQPICSEFSIPDTLCYEFMTFDCNCEIITANSSTTVEDGYNYGGDINPLFKIYHNNIQMSTLPNLIGWQFNGNQFKFKYLCGFYDLKVEDISSASCPPLDYTVTQIGATQFTAVISNLSIGDTYSYSLDDGITWNFNASATTFTVVQLTAGHVYKLKLKRHCQNGQTAINSSSTTITLGQQPCVTPVISISNITGNSLVVNINNFQVGQGYDISVDGGTTWVLSNIISSSILVSGLTSSTSYQVVARATCTGTPISAPITTTTSVAAFSIQVSKTYVSGGNGLTTGTFDVVCVLKDNNFATYVSPQDIDFNLYTIDGTGAIAQDFSGLQILAGQSTKTFTITIDNPAEYLAYDNCIVCGTIDFPCILGVPAKPCFNCIFQEIIGNDAKFTLRDCCGNDVPANTNITIVFITDAVSGLNGIILAGQTSVTVPTGQPIINITIQSNTASLNTCI